MPVTSTPESAQNPYDGPAIRLYSPTVVALATWLLEQITEDERESREWADRINSGTAPAEGLISPNRRWAECGVKQRMVRALLAQAERGHALDAFETLGIMAEPYAACDRPGYREEWRP